MMPTQKPVIFISHVHEDNAIALKLASHIDNAFLGALEVFVSSDGSSIRGGDRWLQKIEDGLRSSQIVLVIISRHSTARKWVYFECGGAFFLGARVIPLLDGSVSVNELGPPLNYLQVCLLTDPIHIAHVFSLLAEAASMKVPKVDFEQISADFSLSTKGHVQKDVPLPEDTEDTEDESSVLATSAKELLNEIFTARIREFKTTADEAQRQKAERELNDLLDRPIVGGDPPAFLREQWRDLCIKNERLYFTEDMIDIVATLMGDPDTPVQKKTELVKWIGRLALGE